MRMLKGSDLSDEEKEIVSKIRTSQNAKEQINSLLQSSGQPPLVQKTPPGIA